MDEYDTLVVVLGAVEDGDPARYFSTQGFTTGSGDTPAGAVFSGRITEDIEYQRQFACVFWGNVAPSSSIGAVQLINSDGALDELLSLPVRDRTVQIYRGVLGAAFSAYELCGSAIADRVDFPSLDRAVLVLQDKAALLDRTLQSAIYSSANNSAIDGQVKPVLAGYCLSIPAILIHPGHLDYDLHDEPPYGVDRVRFNGVERTEGSEWEASGNGFQALISVESFRVTADANGASASSLSNMVSYMLYQRGLLTSDDLDYGTIEALSDSTEYTLGYFADRPVTGKQFMVELMASFGGGYWFNRLNKLAVGRLEDPAGLTSVLTITEASLDLDGTISIEHDRAPGFSNVCAGQRNWYVHQANEIASSLTDPDYLQIAADLQQDYRVRRAGVPSGGGDPDVEREMSGRVAAGIRFDFGGADRGNRNTGIGTLLTDASHIQAEATRWVLLYEPRRHFYTLPVLVAKLAAVADLEPCQCVTVELAADPPIPGYTGRFGLDTAKQLQVVGIRGRFLSGRVDLRLWG